MSDICAARHPVEKILLCVLRPGHAGPHVVARDDIGWVDRWSGEFVSSTRPVSTPEKPSDSHSPGLAASETPQDAREVQRRERRKRYAAEMRQQDDARAALTLMLTEHRVWVESLNAALTKAEQIRPEGGPEWVQSGTAMRTTVLREIRAAIDAVDAPMIEAREAEADREYADLVKRAEDAEAREARLRAGIERMAAYGLTGFDLTPTTKAQVSQEWLYQYLAEVDAAWRQRLSALTTSDADAQTEIVVVSPRPNRGGSL